MFNGSTASATRVVDDVHFAFSGKTLTVTNSQWRTRAKVTKGAPHYGLLRMDIECQPLYETVTDEVRPGGLLGQTFDDDAAPVNGRRDRYDRLDNGQPTTSRTGKGGTVTTRANGEGAIEGVAEDYRIRDPYNTSFRFSRFQAKRASARRVELDMQTGRLRIATPRQLEEDLREGVEGGENLQDLSTIRRPIWSMVDKRGADPRRARQTDVVLMLQRTLDRMGSLVRRIRQWLQPA